MGCCGSKKEKSKPSEVKQSRFSPAVKSNRVPAGRLVRQCTTCLTRSISDICPICGTPMAEAVKN